MTVSRHLSYMALPVLFLCCAFARAESRCVATVASVVSIQGNVDIRGKDTEAWRPITADEGICAGDSVSVRRYSRALLRLELEQTNVQLGEGTTLTLPGTKDGAFSVIELLKGITHFISRVPHALKIKTPFVNAAVEGTEFIVKVDDQQTLVSVTEGRVNADNAAGQLTLQSGQSAMTTRGTAPGAYTVTDTMGAVQWALYYPHVFEFEPKDITNFGLEPWRAIVADSIRALRANDLRTALTLLEQAGEDITSKNYLLYRAHLLLQVGRVAEAQEDIERVLDIDATSSVAWVMRAVIAVTQGRAKVALEAAQKAVQADASSAPAQLALSYAYQAQFDLDNALKAALTAARKGEDSALAWARVAELHLMHGMLDEALEAAQQAEKLNPNSAQAKTVLGFAYLVQLQFESAALALNSAAHFDPGSPLPRLGLGLVKIRQGDLAGGRAQLEIATSLDPRNSLLRSYVGKAYYEENRGKLASEQFAQAKQLDPNDPTPWFYDAILKQAQNRPVDALQDMQKSIALNDNRAVYRSRLLLDDDLATRSASQARIYQNLGFGQLALVEGYKSVNTDPSNFAAHRFLADAYATLPRHEIARVSELLQAHLLQPINSAPMQPQLEQTDLAMLGGVGPALLSANEFNSLFTRNGVSFLANGIGGSNDTRGEDILVAANSGRYMASVGQFHFETGGFRANDDLQRDQRGVFAQVAVNPKLSLQAELRREETEAGDVPLFFNNLHRPDLRDVIKHDTARIGLHYKPTPSQDLLFFIASEEGSSRRTNLTSAPPPLPYVEKTQISDEGDGHHLELQHLIRADSYGVVSGAGSVLLDSKEQEIIEVLENGVVVPGYSDLYDSTAKTKHVNAYLYAPINITANATIILGASYDAYKANAVKETQVNPKFGLTWTFNHSTAVRLAAFRVLKRTLIANQTLEPTQVAGFNQFFDDYEGADTKRYGFGVDHRFSSRLYGGIELSRRDLTVPSILEGIEVKRDWNEALHRAYMYWAPYPELAVSIEYSIEAFDREYTPLQGNLTFPSRVKTQSLPLAVKYSFGNGVFAGLAPTYVKQTTEFVTDTGIDAGQDSFWGVDASVGYRLPRRYGLVSVEVRNLFDTGFKYQSAANPGNNPALSRYQPERSVFAKFSLTF